MYGEWEPMQPRAYRGLQESGRKTNVSRRSNAAGGRAGAKVQRRRKGQQTRREPRKVSKNHMQAERYTGRSWVGVAMSATGATTQENQEPPMPFQAQEVLLKWR